MIHNNVKWSLVYPTGRPSIWYLDGYDPATGNKYIAVGRIEAGSITRLWDVEFRVWDEVPAED